MKLRRKLLDRRYIKSSEGELLWELENSYSLFWKLSSSIMMTALKICCNRFIDPLVGNDFSAGSLFKTPLPFKSLFDN